MEHWLIPLTDIKKAIIFYHDIMLLRNDYQNKLYTDVIHCGSYQETLNVFNELSKIMCSDTYENIIIVYPSFNRIVEEIVNTVDDFYREDNMPDNYINSIIDRENRYNNVNMIIDGEQYNKIEQDFKTMDNGYIELAFIIENDNSFKYITNEEYKKYLEDKGNMFTPDVINDMKQWIKEIEDKKHSGNKCVMYPTNILSTILDKFPPEDKPKCEEED